MLSRLTLTVLLFAIPASAQFGTPDACSTSETEIPYFADSRTGPGCLVVDPGNGEPNVEFQHQIFHVEGVDTTAANDVTEPVPFDIVNTRVSGTCLQSTSTYCNIVCWDCVIDNYLSHEVSGEDVIFVGRNGENIHDYWWKNFRISNGWFCNLDGAPEQPGWKGPNGLICPPGLDSGGHVDGIQYRGAIGVGNGQITFQDGEFVNGYHLHMINEFRSANNSHCTGVGTPTACCTGVGTGDNCGVWEEKGWSGPPNWLFQNVYIGRLDKVGRATTWTDDCLARHPFPPGNPDICAKGVIQFYGHHGYMWFVDVDGTALFPVQQRVDKVIVVRNEDPTKFEDGWPWPIKGNVTGPGTCPNGIIGSGSDCTDTGPCYCYTSIEEARDDVFDAVTCPDCPHALPRYLQYSTAGWADKRGKGEQAGTSNPNAVGGSNLGF